MASKVIAPSVDNFEAPEYDNNDVEKVDIVLDMLDRILYLSEQRINTLASQHKAAEDAVDACIESCLSATDIVYIARDDRPKSTVSLIQGSWEPELPPEPCSADSWLRSVLPEVDKQAAPVVSGDSIRPSMSPSYTSRRPLTSSNGRLDSSPEKAARLGSARVGVKPAYSPLVTSKKPLTAEELEAEERLREELVVRRAQDEIAKSMAQKDAETRAAFANLQKALRGKEYSYDHKGQVVVLNQIDPDRLAETGVVSQPDFRVATPPQPDSPGSHAKHPTAKSQGAGKSKETKTKGTKERHGETDFLEAAPQTQPSALETMKLVGGVTLRQGAAAKMGPPRVAGSGLGMTRTEFQAYAAKATRKGVAGPHVAAPSGPTLTPKATINNRTGKAAKQPGAGSGDDAEAGETATPPGETVAAVGAAKTSSPGNLASSIFAVDAKPAWLAEGVARKRVDSSDGKTEIPDINAALVSAPDWGAGGGGHVFNAPTGLKPVKPKMKQLEEEMGRTTRLPRARAQHATLAPPLTSPKSTAIAKG